VTSVSFLFRMSDVIRARHKAQEALMPNDSWRQTHEIRGFRPHHGLLGSYSASEAFKETCKRSGLI
jgi:hypothetical protein